MSDVPRMTADEPQPEATLDRRPIATRELGPSKWAAARLAAAGISPNAISVAGMIAALVGGGLLILTAEQPRLARPAWLLAALCAQLRLLANMFDGMVAVATGQTSAVGELYNEVPDRVSDVALLVGLGYAASSYPALGWAAAVAAVLTAYVRAMGKAAGTPNDFSGPMAKPQRMFLLTITALFCGLTPTAWHVWTDCGCASAPVAALSIIVVGSLFTAARRLRNIALQLGRRNA